MKINVIQMATASMMGWIIALKPRQDSQSMRKDVSMKVHSSKISMAMGILAITRLKLMKKPDFESMKLAMHSLSTEPSGLTRTAMDSEITLAETMQISAQLKMEPHTLTHLRLVVKTMVMVGPIIGAVINSQVIQHNGMIPMAMVMEIIGALLLGMIRETPHRRVNSLQAL